MKLLTIICAVCAALTALYSAQAATLNFELRSGDETFMLYIEVESEGRDTVYRSQMEAIEQYYRYEPGVRLMEWRYRDGKNGTDYRAVRNGDLIELEGSLRGEEIRTSIELGDRLWLQNSEFGFDEFIESDDRQMYFVFVKPDDVSLTTFRIRKTGIVRIPYQGGEVEALELKATPRGLLAALWQAYYWYSMPDHVFIKYEADAAPGVPRTVIEFIGPSGER
jgi:hypothetical protein